MIDFDAGVDSKAGASLPLAHFFRLVSTGRAPQRADRAAAGTLPTRAFRFCEAVTSASAFAVVCFFADRLQPLLAWRLRHPLDL